MPIQVPGEFRALDEIEKGGTSLEPVHAGGGQPGIGGGSGHGSMGGDRFGGAEVQLRDDI